MIPRGASAGGASALAWRARESQERLAVRLRGLPTMTHDVRAVRRTTATKTCRDRR